MEDKKSYYAIIPADVRYDKELTANAKLLYGEITALCNQQGFCWASNNYFANLYDCTPQAVSRWIKSLEKSEYLKIEYIYEGKEITKRKIYLKEVSTDIDTVSINSSGGINKKLIGYQQIVKENNTYTNNTSNNKDNPKQIKHKHGEYQHIFLTEDEYNKLKTEVPDYEKWIAKVDEGIEMKGYKYKNHYLAILNWIKKEKEFTISKMSEADKKKQDRAALIKKLTDELEEK